MISDGTIIALSTPPGMGAIALIRLSGPAAITKVSKVFRARSGKILTAVKSHTVIFGEFMVDQQPLDEVLITVFRGPHSYTGENVVEIACHGSPFIQQKIIQHLITLGVAPAQPGEFTLRAYLNRKMDLSQAEAVADLIASESAAAHQLALQQMRGGFSNEIQALRKQLIEFTALIELELDFSEEDVAFADRAELQILLTQLHKKLSTLMLSFEYGNVIKEGVAVAIAGKPNAGKSSLLNLLLNEERAIVSDIAGTTRDIIEDTVVLEGVKFRFIDTAGLRKTTDTIEAIGVKKAREKVQKAKILLYLYDRMDTTVEAVIEDVKSLNHQGLITLLVDNKIDQYSENTNSPFNTDLWTALKGTYANEHISLSTFDSNTVEKLKKTLLQTVNNLANDSSVVISNARHFNALKSALDAIEVVTEGVVSGLSGDLLSIELKEAIAHIATITGEIDVDRDILGTIFGQFCIGK